MTQHLSLKSILHSTGVCDTRTWYISFRPAPLTADLELDWIEHCRVLALIFFLKDTRERRIRRGHVDQMLTGFTTGRL
jgi:hypothetical protein